LARILDRISIFVAKQFREKGNILVIAEESVLLLADLDSVTAEL
jgi:hypothetical protein